MRKRGCFQLSLYCVQALSISLAVCTLVACASDGNQWNPDDYTVKSGDTVYSIAWRYELDPEAFVQWNHLGASKRIYPGQRLHTRKPPGFDSSAYRTEGSRDTSYSSKKWVKVKKGDSLSQISVRTGVSVNRIAQLNQLKKPYVIYPGQTLYLKPLSTETAKSSSPPSRKSTTKTAASTTQTGTWPKSVRWKRPAKGKVVKKFNRNRNDAKGIDIQGQYGDNIVASAAGKVVYSGNGLISYGNLIIIKHNQTYLSAYAYNRKLLVKEGDSVRAGQRIAEMGRKEKLGSRLHFEIRKNGKPVDPLKYLPW